MYRVKNIEVGGKQVKVRIEESRNEIAVEALNGSIFGGTYPAELEVDGAVYRADSGKGKAEISGLGLEAEKLILDGQEYRIAKNTAKKAENNQQGLPLLSEEVAAVVLNWKKEGRDWKKLLENALQYPGEIPPEEQEAIVQDYRKKYPNDRMLLNLGSYLEEIEEWMQAFQGLPGPERVKKASELDEIYRRLKDANKKG